jgi:hypothetical protein
MERANVEIYAVYSYYVLNTTAKYTSDGNMSDKDNYDGWGHEEFDSPALHVTPIYRDEKVSVGETLTVQAKDIEGYTFYAWRTQNSILSHDKTYTFTMRAGDLYLYAIYVQN